VVGEAAVSGTPVISSDNGCLPEIVPLVGTVIPEGTALAPARARRVLEGLPRPAEVREAALAAWHYRTIAEQYEELYERVETGSWW
jgi:glycosyltransferase involved in cell wall biosynthesis